MLSLVATQDTGSIQHTPHDISADKSLAAPQNCQTQVSTSQTICLHHLLFSVFPDDTVHWLCMLLRKMTQTDTCYLLHINTRVNIFLQIKLFLHRQEQLLLDLLQ